MTGRKKRRSHQSRSGNSSSKPSSVSSQQELVVFQFDEETVPSGEWEGHMVDFVVDEATKLPNASKLPDHVVPPAYDDWAVDVFDWQTQCAMKATGEGDVVVYKDMKFIPVAGCEVDASVIHEQFEGEMKNVLHFNPGCGDFNASDDETVTHVLTRKGSTQKDGYARFGTARESENNATAYRGEEKRSESVARGVLREVYERRVVSRELRRDQKYDEIRRVPAKRGEV